MNKMLKRLISFVTAIMLLLSLTACSSTEKPNTETKTDKTRYEAEFLELFDTVTKIIGYANSEEEFKGYSQIIYDNLKQYHELYDIYNDYQGINNIKTINDNAGIKPVKVDKKIIDLLKFSKDAYTMTNGKTNVAFGAVLKIWHDYRTEGIADPENAKLPPIEDLKKASQHTDINNMIIDEANSTVFLKDPEMSLDVGAIAKGYATEQVSKVARDSGMTSALLSVGGNVRAINNNEVTNAPWNVGVQNPDTSSENSVLKTVKIDDASLVTSGDYERYYTVDGKRYNHIINPETLSSAEFFTSVSIITKDSGKADALSTALFNMNYDEGFALIKSLPDTEAMWIFKDGTMKFSEGFEKLLKE